MRQNIAETTTTCFFPECDNGQVEKYSRYIKRDFIFSKNTIDRVRVETYLPNYLTT